MNFSNIPNLLKETGHFCGWRLEPDKKGRATKVPYNVLTGYKAKSNDISTFTDFITTTTVAQSGKYDGIGVGLFDNLCAIDIDDCVKDGVLSEMAQDIINTMNAYTEYSPSGNGVHILFTVNDFSYEKTAYYINKRDIGLEVYVASITNKYVTVTGNVISAGEYSDRTAELQIILDKYMTKQDKNTVEPVSNQPIYNLSDEEILEKAKAAKNSEKFNALYSGDISAYPSHSEADLALCSMLAFWCGCDTAQIDRIFRGSGLYREKWDEPRNGTTYGQNVIEQAVRSCKDVYNSGLNSAPYKSSSLKPDDFTDIGQARVLSREYGDKLRFSRATKWLFYTGDLWK
jgi:primase-polymerase (primpol)-like protein